MRSAVGVHRYQAFRANREHPPEAGSAVGWTYNHQPYLAYWNAKFYLQYLSNEKAEHLPPGRTLILTSEDGRRWTRPEVVFPEYALPAFTFKDPETGRSYDIPAGTKSVMHQRMGFYVTRDGRLLTFGFYSFCPSPKFGPNNGQGFGRVVREIHGRGAVVVVTVEARPVAQEVSQRHSRFAGIGILVDRVAELPKHGLVGAEQSPVYGCPVGAGSIGRRVMRRLSASFSARYAENTCFPRRF